MAGNTFGHLFKLTSFGESHGDAIGGIIDGCPAGLSVDFDFIQQELNRRRPGQSQITTSRNETDLVEFLSGIHQGITLGTPIGFIVKNNNQKSSDYAHLQNVYRPGHADFVYEKKYGVRDYRGGGRSSARETVSRVVAGAVAKLLLKKENIIIQAFVKQIGPVKLQIEHQLLNLSLTETNNVRCPDAATAADMEAYILKLKEEGDTCGGVIQCVIHGVPAGLGEPVFDKLHAELGKAMLSINAVKGFEIGSGFESINKKGSELNDIFEWQGETLQTLTNNSGGIQGGISNGMPVWFNVAFKPVSSIRKEQSVVTNSGESSVLKIEGRHDPCVVPRAVPIVESMAALVIADYLLLRKSNTV